jgi:hypothetical protein
MALEMRDEGKDLRNQFVVACKPQKWRRWAGEAHLSQSAVPGEMKQLEY